MPTYSYECTECGLRFELYRAIGDRDQRCRCGGETWRIPSAPGVSIFRSGFYEHVGPSGTWADTPQQLQDACNKYDAYSEYLENSTFRVHRDYEETEKAKEVERERREVEWRNRDDPRGSFANPVGSLGSAPGTNEG